MNDDLKDLAGSGCGLNEKQSQNVAGGIEENHENPSHDSWCLGRDSKLASPE
jgi:hypothetical protein